MASREARFSMCHNAIWKETAMWMKHYRKHYCIEEYNQIIMPLIELYRKIEFEIKSEIFISRADYRIMIKNLNNNLQKDK